MFESESGFSLEAESRRRGWTTGGMAVRLADDYRWHLPAITPALLMSTPGLREDLKSILAVTTRADRAAKAGEDDADNFSSYCNRMGALAQRLLGVNYDLPDCTWHALLTYNNIIGLYTMMMFMSFALDSAREDWRPWLDAAHDHRRSQLD